MTTVTCQHWYILPAIGFAGEIPADVDLAAPLLLKGVCKYCGAERIFPAFSSEKGESKAGFVWPMPKARVAVQ